MLDGLYLTFGLFTVIEFNFWWWSRLIPKFFEITGNVLVIAILKHKINDLINPNQVLYFYNIRIVFKLHESFNFLPGRRYDILTKHYTSTILRNSDNFDGIPINFIMLSCIAFKYRSIWSLTQLIIGLIDVNVLDWNLFRLLKVWCYLLKRSLRRNNYLIAPWRWWERSRFLRFNCNLVRVCVNVLKFWLFLLHLSFLHF